ncbi:hypothetical protein OF83DRAFT_1174330 [Amylostereum chailletii]|nr:hypothetical protein OF83DRAFT_1174330 [Amylostereum chailletii]
MSDRVGYPPKTFAPTTASQIAARICEHCLQPPKRIGASNTQATLLRCTSCRRVGYCDAACQKSDWKMHKLICPRLKEINEWDKNNGPGEKYTSDQYMNLQRLRSAVFANNSQENPYGEFPAAYIQEQVKCEVCFRTPFQQPEFHRFPSCSRCQLAWWCSPECKEVFSKHHTRAHCDERLDVACVDRFRIDYAVKRRSQRQYMISSPQPRTSYIRLSKMKGWEDYYRRGFPEWNRVCTRNALEFSATNKLAERALRLLTKESAVYPLTILAALEHIYSDISERTSLVIHVVGAGEREMSGQGMTEEVLHYLPKLQEVHFSLIGDEVNADPFKSNVACATCKGRGRTRDTEYYRGDYQDFMTTGPGASEPAPDLVVGLNTGMSEVDTERWKPALELILKKNIPAVFTTYSRVEADHEEAMLRGLGVRFLKNVERNKWKGVVPKINIYFKEEGEGHTTLFNSYYWYVIQGKV